MWPRGDAPPNQGSDISQGRRSKNSGLSGFVSFMKRKDAEAAVREFDGYEWQGNVLRVGWSKAVPIGPRALYGETPILLSSSPLIILCQERKKGVLILERELGKSGYLRLGVPLE